MKSLQHNLTLSQKLVQQGFTLIELMMVVIILSILTAVSLPRYQQYRVNQIQRQAQQQSLLLAEQLAHWRAKRLTYAGFIVDDAASRNEENATDTTNLTSVGYGQRYVPAHANADNYHYLITLKDANGHHYLYQPDANGNGWRMLVTPNTAQQVVKYADSYYLDSVGQRCRFQHGQNLPDLPRINDEVGCVVSW